MNKESSPPKNYVLNVFNPIGVILSCVLSLIFTFAEPLGIYLLDPIACPQEGCHVDSEQYTRYGHAGRSNHTEFMCVCPGGTTREIPIWIYFLHFVAFALLGYIPFAIYEFIANSRKSEVPTAKKKEPETSVIRIVFSVAIVLFLICFVIYYFS